MGKSQTGRAASGLCKDPNRATRLPALSEADLERYGTELLALDGWRGLKTDPVSDKSRGKGFGEVGMADYLYIRYGVMRQIVEFVNILTGVDTIPPLGDFDSMTQTLWIEWKRPNGRVEAHQGEWQRRERERGALVVVAGVDFPASPEGFYGWYKHSGLMRREIR